MNTYIKTLLDSFGNQLFPRTRVDAVYLEDNTTELGDHLQTKQDAPTLDKTTPIDGDKALIYDSADSNVAKKLSWANIKATLKTYFDTLYNLYTHPTTDGNLHVPATSTTNNGRVLKAGATAGSLVWGTDNDTIYTHPTTTGNRHIPAGGTTNQILRFSADGTAVWGTDNDTIYTHPTTSGNRHIPAGGTTNQILRFSADGTAVWGADNDTIYTHPTGDGNLHVPATGTTNNGRVLTAGATAGSLSWVTPAASTLASLGVTATSAELNHTTGVTSAIQTQLNARAPIASPTFTGTVSGITSTMVGLSNVTNESKTTMFTAPTFTGRTVFANGSIATPSFSFAGETGLDTGLYWVADGSIGFASNSAHAGTISAGGNLTMVGNITAFSDERLKSKIQTIPNALEKVLALRGVEYDKGGTRGIGVIAQEVQKIIPEVVLDSNDEMNTLSVAYGNLVGLLIEAIKDQQVQIDELKALVEKQV